jgi:L-ribulose-5-phosphate 4-epimerase
MIKIFTERSGIMDEGYIKYNCQWIHGEPVLFEGFKEINDWRQRLHQLGIIGMNSNKIGFGNISLRVPGTNQFYITGSATGGVNNLTEAHYTRVVDFDITI